MRPRTSCSLAPTDRAISLYASPPYLIPAQSLSEWPGARLASVLSHGTVAARRRDRSLAMIRRAAAA
eukprot:766752-Hanusia_phi.AAC.6